MYEKHAVWCQCAVVFTFVLAVSSTMSVQHLTLAVDVYWSGVFMTLAFLQFAIAEHAPIFGVTQTSWLKLQPNTFAYAVLLTWSFTSWQGMVACVHVPVLAAALRWRNPKVVLVAACAVRTVVSWDTCLLALYALLALRHRPPSILNKSMASREQKQRFLRKSVEIWLQSVALWLVRCEHRFPHVVRRTPMVTGVVAIVLALVWCHLNVAKTRVSQNAIIVGDGHGMAASLAAAEACPICCQHLTALDMESSFSDASEF